MSAHLAGTTPTDDQAGKANLSTLMLLHYAGSLMADRAKKYNAALGSAGQFASRRRYHSESDHLVEAKITACLEGDRMLSSSFSLRVFLSPALSLKLAKTLNRKWNLVILLP